MQLRYFHLFIYLFVAILLCSCNIGEKLIFQCGRFESVNLNSSKKYPFIQFNKDSTFIAKFSEAEKTEDLTGSFSIENESVILKSPVGIIYLFPVDSSLKIDLSKSTFKFSKDKSIDKNSLNFKFVENSFVFNSIAEWTFYELTKIIDFQTADFGISEIGNTSGKAKFKLFNSTTSFSKLMGVDYNAVVGYDRIIGEYNYSRWVHEDGSLSDLHFWKKDAETDGNGNILIESQLIINGEWIKGSFFNLEIEDLSTKRILVSVNQSSANWKYSQSFIIPDMYWQRVTNLLAPKPKGSNPPFEKMWEEEMRMRY